MKLIKSKPFAVAVMIIAIVASVLISIPGMSAAPSPEDGGVIALDHSLSTAEYRPYVVDHAGVLSAKTEDMICIYNANWVELSRRVMAVVTVEYAEDLGADAWFWFDELELYDDDALLLIDAGSECYYVVALGSFYETLSGMPSGFLDDAMYHQVMAGDYDTAVLNLFEDIHSLHREIDITNVVGGVFRMGLVFLLIMTVVIVIIVCSVVDSVRYSNWHTRYGTMTAPPVVYRPILWWHRPGSMWYRRRRWAPPPPPHSMGGGPRPHAAPPRPPVGGGYRPPVNHGPRPHSPSRPTGGGFSGGRTGGGFSGGRSGGGGRGRR